MHPWGAGLIYASTNMLGLPDGGVWSPGRSPAAHAMQPFGFPTVPVDPRTWDGEFLLMPCLGLEPGSSGLGAMHYDAEPRDPTLPDPALPHPTRTYPTLPYPTLPYPTLPYPTLPYPTLPYPTLPYPTLPYPTLPYPTLPYPALPCPALPCPALPCPALPCPALPSLPYLPKPPHLTG